MHDEADQLVELTTRPNELDAGLICEVLRSGGIDCTTRQANGAALGIFGASTFNPVAVLVKAGDVHAARRLLENRRSESVDIDWSEVDVGEPADEIARGIAERGTGSDRSSRLKPGSKAGIVAALALVVLLLGAVAGTAAMWIAAAVIAGAAALNTLRGGPSDRSRGGAPDEEKPRGDGSAG